MQSHDQLNNIGVEKQHVCPHAKVISFKCWSTCWSVSCFLNIAAFWLVDIVDFPSWLNNPLMNNRISCGNEQSSRNMSENWLYVGDPQRREWQQVVASLSMLTFWLVWGQSRLLTVNWSWLYSGSLPPCVHTPDQIPTGCISTVLRENTRMNPRFSLYKSWHLIAWLFSYYYWLLRFTSTIMRKCKSKSFIHT